MITSRNSSEVQFHPTGNEKATQHLEETPVALTKGIRVVRQEEQKDKMTMTVATTSDAVLQMRRKRRIMRRMSDRLQGKKNDSRAAAIDAKDKRKQPIGEETNHQIFAAKRLIDQHHEGEYLLQLRDPKGVRAAEPVTQIGAPEAASTSVDTHTNLRDNTDSNDNRVNSDKRFVTPPSTPTRCNSKGRELRFADDVGKTLAVVHYCQTMYTHEHAPGMSRAIILLMNPRKKKFEFMHVSYHPFEKLSISDVLRYLPDVASHESLKDQAYVGLCRVATGGKELINTVSIQGYELDKDEILVAILQGMSAKSVMNIANPLLSNRKVLKAVSYAGCDVEIIQLLTLVDMAQVKRSSIATRIFLSTETGPVVKRQTDLEKKAERKSKVVPIPKVAVRKGRNVSELARAGLLSSSKDFDAPPSPVASDVSPSISPEKPARRTSWRKSNPRQTDDYDDLVFDDLDGVFDPAVPEVTKEKASMARLLGLGVLASVAFTFQSRWRRR